MSHTDTISVAFHETARTHYFALLEDFYAHSAGIDRRVEELRYRDTCSRYTHSLRRQLEEDARELLHRNQQHPQIGAIDQHLQQAIGEYVHEFVQKTR